MAIEPKGVEVYTVKEAAEALAVSSKTLNQWCQQGKVLHCELVANTWLMREPFKFFASARDRELYEAMSAAAVAPILTTGDIHNLMVDWRPDALFRCINSMLRREDMKAVWSEARVGFVYALADRMDEVPDAQAIDINYVEPKAPVPKRTYKPKPKAPKPPPPPPPPPPMPARMGFAEMANFVAGTIKR